MIEFAENVGRSGKKIGRADGEVAGRIGSDLSRPAHEEGNAMPPFEDVGLVSPPVRVGEVPPGDQVGNPGGGGSATQFSNGSGPNRAGTAGRGSAAGGINESASAGINYTDQWGARMDFRTSYQFSSNHNRLDQNRLEFVII